MSFQFWVRKMPLPWDMHSGLMMKTGFGFLISGIVVSIALIVDSFLFITFFLGVGAGSSSLLN